jgi:hypothetical protein
MANKEARPLKRTGQARDGRSGAARRGTSACRAHKLHRGLFAYRPSALAEILPGYPQQGRATDIVMSMRSIGFDLPESPKTAAARKLAGMLTGLEHEVTSRGMTGRELLAVAFDHHRGRIELVTRRQPLGADYPDLSTVLTQIALTCVQDAIALSQFRRIVFAEKQITLELVDAWGSPQVYVYSIRPVTDCA